jgi:23S rRNA pseudouridine1911/1915/1917 synthase
LGWALERYPSIRAITAAPGRHDYGLIHRLDTATSGLLLVALTQSAYDSLLAEQAAGRFVKEYRAVCAIKSATAAVVGYPPCPVQWERSPDEWCCSVESRFRPWGTRGQAVRPVTEESGLAARKKATPRTYRTDIRVEPANGATVQALCRITEGFRHQVRCHLAWLGLPVVGDVLYGNFPDASSLQFFATGLFFHLPSTSPTASPDVFERKLVSSTDVLDKNYAFRI